MSNKSRNWIKNILFYGRSNLGHKLKTNKSDLLTFTLFLLTDYLKIHFYFNSPVKKVV